MNSLILRTATLYTLPLLLLFSVFLLLRGHNEPGGGFVGGLMAAAALIQYAIAYDVVSARTLLRADPHVWIGSGLLTALFSGLLSVALAEPYLTGEWLIVNVPVVGELHVGTPLLFDIGVYLVVFGVTVLMIFSLLEE